MSSTRLQGLVPSGYIRLASAEATQLVGWLIIGNCTAQGGITTKLQCWLAIQSKLLSLRTTINISFYLSSNASPMVKPPRGIALEGCLNLKASLVPREKDSSTPIYSGREAIGATRSEAKEHSELRERIGWRGWLVSESVRRCANPRGGRRSLWFPLSLGICPPSPLERGIQSSRR